MNDDYTPLNVRTRLMPATDTQPQRVRARGRFGEDIRTNTVSWNSAQSVFENHGRAATTLLAKNGISSAHLRMEREGTTGYTFQVVS